MEEGRYWRRKGDSERERSIEQKRDLSADSYSNQGLRTVQSVSQSQARPSVPTFAAFCPCVPCHSLKLYRDREDGSASHNVWHDDDDDDERTGMS